MLRCIRNNGESPLSFTHRKYIYFFAVWFYQDPAEVKLKILVVVTRAFLWQDLGTRAGVNLLWVGYLH